MANLKELLNGLWHNASGNLTFIFTFNSNNNCKGVISVISNGFVDSTEKPKNFVFNIEFTNNEPILHTLAFGTKSNSLKIELLVNSLKLDESLYLYR